MIETCASFLRRQVRPYAVTTQPCALACSKLDSRPKQLSSTSRRGCSSITAAPYPLQKLGRRVRHGPTVVLFDMRTVRTTAKFTETHSMMSISSTKVCPTSAHQRSSFSRSKEHRHGLRRPVAHSSGAALLSTSADEKQRRNQTDDNLSFAWRRGGPLICSPCSESVYCRNIFRPTRHGGTLYQRHNPWQLRQTDRTTAERAAYSDFIFELYVAHERQARAAASGRLPQRTLKQEHVTKQAPRSQPHIKRTVRVPARVATKQRRLYLGSSPRGSGKVPSRPRRRAPRSASHLRGGW